MTRTTMTRRHFVVTSGIAGLVGCTAKHGETQRHDDTTAPVTTPEGMSQSSQTPGQAPAIVPAAATTDVNHAMHTRVIPNSGEAIPVIGLGTWQKFDVGDDPEARANVQDVVRAFLDAGGKVIDSSPMYGRSEAVTGDTLLALGKIGVPFLATKVWTTGRERGIAQMRDSLKKMQTQRMDLMQVHNLKDWRTHLPVLREWKAAGVIRYIGVTHYDPSAFAELETLMRNEQLDFVQLPYNLAEREVERRLLPTATDTKTAVLVMTPFGSGDLFRWSKGRALPAWAAEIDCTSWAQLFLKFIVSHPAVHCPLPATSNPKHVVDNMQAGRGRLPDESMRKRLVALLDA